MTDKKNPRGQAGAQGTKHPDFRSENNDWKVPRWLYVAENGTEIYSLGFPGMYGAQRVSVDEDEQGNSFQKCWTQRHLKLDEETFWIEPTRPQGHGWQLHQTINRPSMICWEWRRAFPEEGER